ncbi:C6 transcription factor [Pochonia chlamydosporia 170]|uniref:C6 transcription factor n=1 Tax=Pochonia chlamydosporia 170 TaxID=1380566 RepID=A0A179F0B4_METCM|nr:C6 transcription factor [Pochonia chlamydosporia 170]OAQ58895.1 C6 transcription factor [Pochonia chlamydosporia 170]
MDANSLLKEPRKARRTANGYLKDLQKRTEATRSLLATTTTTTATRKYDQESHDGSQHSPNNDSTLLSESRTTTHTFNTSPISRSSLQDEPLCGQKRSNEKAFGINGVAIFDPRMDATPTSPAMAPIVQFPQLNVLPGSYSGPDPLSGPASYPPPNTMKDPNAGSVVGPDPGSMSSHYPQVASPLSSIWSSTFTMPAKTIRNTQRNKRAWMWLAPWSTWSFTVRLTPMLTETLYPGDSSLPPSLFSTEIYSLKYKTSTACDVPYVTDLPSNLPIYEEDELEDEIRDFYPNALQRATESPLWFCKFLLTIAFGTAFHAPPRDSPDPPGSNFLAMEILALGGLYLYSTDQREGANFFLGQAIRIAQLEGMHTHLPEHELVSKMAADARDLWWTLYITDRHFSSSVGLPMSMQDSDITTPVNPPGIGSAADTARSLQVNLSHLMSLILTTVYKPGVTELAVFLEQTRSILHTLAHHAQEIEKIISIKFQKSAGTMPRDTRLLTLLYRQCVIFATRPLLLSVMKERLSMLGFQGDENWTDFLAQTGSVLSTGIKSAAKTLQILTSEYSVLGKHLPVAVAFVVHSVLENQRGFLTNALSRFVLPYDVEFTVGAALNLTIANALFPDVVDFNSCHEMPHHILNDLVYRRNRVAQARRSELCHLEDLCSESISRGQRKGLQTLHLSGPNPQGLNLDTKLSRDQEGLLSADNEAHPPTRCVATNQSMHTGSHAQPTSDMEFLDNIGISSDEFLSIVQQMGDSGTFPDNMLTLS